GLVDNNVKALLFDHSDNLWVGTEDGVSRYDGENWTTFHSPDGGVYNDIQSLFSDRNGHLWFGTNGGGVIRFDGKVFQTMTEQDGLASNRVNDILQDRDGNMWFATFGGGLTRYRPPEPFPPSIEIDRVIADQQYEQPSMVEVPTTTRILTVAFRGANLKTRPDAMMYRYRLSGYDDEWQTTRNPQVDYQNLPRGEYTFEVQAVDRDLVYSEQPATVAILVHLPYERIGLIAGLGIAIVLIAWQTVRVIRRDRILRASNEAMSDANRDLFALNRELQRDRAVERVRAQVQSMEQASDFDRVLSLLGEDFRSVGLSFDTCGIEVLETPVAEPSMAHFEAHGFHYTTYTIDPDGEVLQNAYNLTAPFPDVIAETLARFVAGDPWQGASSGTAILEVPIGQYGRLRLTASDREAFADDEIEVKTTTRSTRSHIISKLSQLEASPGRTLYLLSIQLAAGSGDDAYSLLELVEALRERLAGNPG
ncbi:MAG: PD-(D/E)XK motif protein, partial [Candidatus Latescibacteria bacterium]|nr:PD-(D/E)XK motif protein [Candidatus Latescibacterota bacterium]